ncbi:MAG: hypothetical protein FJ255_11215 [Phycisphaerae bacterium]|nr:hypothetical protein [Phycisphaerae bacterium]
MPRPPRTRIAALVLASLLAGCESKVTDENFAKVTDGMSYAQVEGLLGSGEDQTATGTGIGGAGLLTAETRSKRKVFVWKEGNKIITVVFDDGKVVEKMREGF